MLFETANQGIIFLAMIYFGFISGIIDEILKPLSVKPKQKFWRFCGDFLRPITFFVIFFCATLICNYGEFRFYLLFGLILGFILEKQFFSKPLKKFCKYIIQKIKSSNIFKKKKTKNKNIISNY